MSYAQEQPTPVARQPIEAVVVCVNYADFLAHTLPANRTQFDRMVVVSDADDERTKQLCEYYNVELVVTDAFYQNGDTFNKGAGINAGLEKLTCRGWVVHLDADIYMPPHTRGIIDRLDLDPVKIYGADRLMCPSYDAWADFICKPEPIQNSWVFIHPTAFPMGVRIAEYMTPKGGWGPIGYFQLWNPGGSGVWSYPTEHGAADRTDVLFSKQWTRSLRELLPEVLLIHLESTTEMGCNWWGRRSPDFGPRRVPRRKGLWHRIRKSMSVLLGRDS